MSTAKMAVLGFVPVLIISLVFGLYVVSAVSPGSQSPFTGGWSSPSPSPAGSNFSTSSPSPSSFLNSSGTYVVHTPPGPANGSVLQPTVQCANYSVPFTALASVGTVNPYANSSYIVGLSFQVECNGCGPQQSDNSPSTTFSNSSGDVTPQWKGTFGDEGRGGVSVSGLCDMGFALDRPQSASQWNVSWTFQKLNAGGNLEVRVSLEYNQTVVFDRSTSAPNGVVSGNFSTGPSTLLQQ
jgi:hypothetical protein